MNGGAFKFGKKRSGRNGLVLEKLRVTNMSVKRFRQMLKKGSQDWFEVLYVTVGEKQSKLLKMKVGKKDARTAALLKKYECVFRSEFSAGLQPERSVEHTIEVEK